MSNRILGISGHLRKFLLFVQIKWLIGQESLGKGISKPIFLPGGLDHDALSIIQFELGDGRSTSDHCGSVLENYDYLSDNFFSKMLISQPGSQLKWREISYKMCQTIWRRLILIWFDFIKLNIINEPALCPWSGGSSLHTPSHSFHSHWHPVCTEWRVASERPSNPLRLKLINYFNPVIIEEVHIELLIFFLSNFRIFLNQSKKTKRTETNASESFSETRQKDISNCFHLTDCRIFRS